MAGSASRRDEDTAAATLLLAVNEPKTWQARTRSSTITGVLEASESSNPFSTILTIVGSSGRGSSSHSDDFSANACVRSWITLAPSP